MRSISPIAQARRALGTKPPITSERIAQLRAQIEAGTYEPDLDVLAARLVAAGAL